MKDEMISTNEAYYKEFKNDFSEKAFDVAIQNRRFEIELYWKRAAYFWTLIAAVFIGYFTLQGKTSEGSIFASFFISCIGLVFSVAWYLMNRSSAYWHANWEAHVQQLEDEVVGPLHKTTIDQNEFSLRSIADPYRLSSTKIHAITSLYIVVIWIFLISKSISTYFGLTEPFTYFNVLLVVFLTATFLFLFFRVCKPGKWEKVKTFIVVEKPLTDYE